MGAVGGATGLLSLVSTGASIVQGVKQFTSAGAEADFAQQKADFDTQQLQLQIDREKTEAAIQARTREEKLRANLARQRAVFGSSGVDPNSGTPFRLQEVAIGSINREQSLSDFASSQNILNLNVQGEQVRIGNAATQSALDGKKTSAVFGTVTGASKILKGSSLLDRF